ncbi:MAG TPA: hypothetical protein VFA26_17200, partial [Gemmataceae bacterium]|nr:hypothetical protein [Gemmataceae bacterium]
MDCRRLLRLAPALFFLGGGCTPQGPQTLPLTPPPPADVVKHEQDLPPRQPKPFTCVKAADFYA